MATAEAPSRTDVTQAVRGVLPGYDPAVRAAASAEPAREEPLPAALMRPRSASPPPARVSRSAESGVVVLPEVRVEAKAEASRPVLPRAHVPPAQKRVELDEMLTPAEREARLVQKHLSAFDRFFLNRVTPLGISKEARAAEAEAREQNARQLNQVADQLELLRASGIDAEEYERMKKLYLEAYHGRVK